MRLYPRLAAGGIRRNGKLYAPYIMTCSLMAMMFYIVNFLSDNSMLDGMKGGGTMKEMLNVGIVIMGIFAAIFLFYTNSFLVKRRKREFGLYNVLGMGKRNIAAVMTWETFFVYLVSMALGIAAGILFSKLAELLAVKIIRGEAQYQFSVSVGSIIATLLVFAVIFLLIYLNVMRQVFTAKPVELLHSENSGEKPPRANWFLAVLGVIILGAAYYMAVTIEEPLTAVLAFMLAVLLVIIATYLLFIAGSVAVCRALQKNRKYYYRTNHFISVSQMCYRMKKNGAGLASICILSTMVLVTLSSTICLYMGTGQMGEQRYPRDIVVSTSGLSEGDIPNYRAEIGEILEKHGCTAQNEMAYSYIELSGAIVGDRLDISRVSGDEGFTLDLRTVYVVPIADYNAMYGRDIRLSDGDAAIYCKGSSFDHDSIQLDDWGGYRLTERLDEFAIIGMDSATVTDSIYLFVERFSDLGSLYDYQENYTEQHGGSLPQQQYYYGFDLDCSDSEKAAIFNDLVDMMREKNHGFQLECRVLELEEYYGMYGGLFFLGIVFGGVFILAAVLIMYYKQISEGYDDRARFDILRKVGMNDREIRRAVNSQVLTVFFAPLVAAGMHMAFAFPLLTKLLGLFSMRDTGFLAAVTLVCYCVFALIYVIVYGVTSRGYFRIVSGRKS